MDFGATKMGKIHIYKPFMGEIYNYVFITSYTMFIQQKFAFIILLPQLSLDSFANIQYKHISLYRSTCTSLILKTSVTRVSYRFVMHIIYPHNCSVYSGEGHVPLTPVTLHYITIQLAHLRQRLIG